MNFIKEAFDSNYVAPLGPMVDAFEQEFAEKVGIPNAVAVSSGTVDFLVARRKYTKSMMRRAKKNPVFGGEFEVKTLLPEDLIGLNIQAISNDPENRYVVDAPDIQRLLALHSDKIDMELVREYFRLFDKETQLDEWLEDIK